MTFNHALYDATLNDDKNAFWNLLYNDQELVKHTIAFDPEWANGTGYYNGAVEAPLEGVEIGEIARSRAPGSNNRRILMVKTQFGNVVVFERYTPKEEQLQGPLVMNLPKAVKQSEMAGEEGALAMETLVKIFGDGSLMDNVGLRLFHFLKTVMKVMTEKEVLDNAV